MAESKTHINLILGQLDTIGAIADEILDEDDGHKLECIAINVALCQIKEQLARAQFTREPVADEITIEALLNHKPKGGFRGTVRAVAALLFMIPVFACSSPALMSRGLTAPTVARGGLVPWVQEYEADPTEATDDAPYYNDDLGLLADYEVNNLS